MSNNQSLLFIINTKHESVTVIGEIKQLYIVLMYTTTGDTSALFFL